MRAFLRIKFFKLILIYNFKIELKKIILLNSEKIAFIYIYIYIFSDNSNRGPIIIKLYFYVLLLHYYIYELYKGIAYSIFNINFNFNK